MIVVVALKEKKHMREFIFMKSIACGSLRTVVVAPLSLLDDVEGLKIENSLRPPTAPRASCASYNARMRVAV